MSQFWKTRIATLIWGFAVTYAFTGQLITSAKMFAVIVIGNTIIMKLLIK